MNGSISVENEPGKGSRFTVSLPLPKAEEVPSEERAEEAYPSLAGRSVLAIDNDPVTLRLMREMYLQNGVKCDTCLSLSELTDRLRDKDYDLLVTDLKMPEANGYEVLDCCARRKSAIPELSPWWRRPPRATSRKGN